MSADEALDALKEVQDFFEDEKERLSNGMYLRMCNAQRDTHIGELVDDVAQRRIGVIVVDPHVTLVQSPQQSSTRVRQLSHSACSVCIVVS